MYGICKFCLVQVRNKPDERSELVTQLLFGDVYEIIEATNDKKWYCIKISYDNYVGWIDASLHFEIYEDFYDQYLTTEHPVSYDFFVETPFVETPLMASLQMASLQKNWLEWGKDKREIFQVLAGSTLPFFSPREIPGKKIKKQGRIQKKIRENSSDFLSGPINAYGSGKTGDEPYEFEGMVLLPGKRKDIKFLIFTAMEFYGVPYLWGGKTVYGTDCSGFVQQIFKICGYKLYRDAFQQAEQGQLVSSFEDCRAGDLAFFEDNEGKISHVGIIMEDNKIIHASGQVKISKIEAKGIFNEATGGYSNLKKIKRII
ncbi:MAG: NlpC/P60 family protein [Cytophagales bacterium]|nr:NlpC/P60 family protein [Cytophagales bacterium]